ncbi:MAG: hypothetical protein H3C47_04725 [Candidatus Cloacimonetes bacterium]|nr:hypothetical protein [Candidatus Cloacimonadota bacterium]
MNFDTKFGKFSGNNAREKMISYIKANYQGILGQDVALLDEEEGLDKIRRKYFHR